MSTADHPTPAAARRYEGRDLEAMSFARNYHRWIFDEIRPFLSGDVAEVGAGRGSFSRLLLESPSIRCLFAMEPSPEMFPLLRAELRGEPRAEPRNAFFGEVAAEVEGRLGAAVYVNVLEHVPDDRGELALVHRALAPGGHLCVFVPALPWLYSPFDASIGHQRRYLRAPLVRMVRETGFEVVRARWFDVAGVLPWLVAMKWLRLPMRGGDVRLYDSLVVPVMRRVEAAVPPPLGKNLLVVARKPG